MNTFNLLLKLSTQKSKKDYLNLADQELSDIVSQLKQLGYNIDKKTGFIGEQSLKPMQHIFIYQYFRDVHFIYWGIKNNQWDNDPVDELYYRGIQGFITNQYKQLP